MNDIQLSLVSKGKKKDPKAVAKSSVTKRALGKNILQFDLEMNLIKEYSCVAEAVEQTGIKQPQISKVLNGTNKTAHGYIFKYK